MSHTYAHKYDKYNLMWLLPAKHSLLYRSKLVLQFGELGMTGGLFTFLMSQSQVLKVVQVTMRGDHTRGDQILKSPKMKRRQELAL